jgi:hypothetical protein
LNVFREEEEEEEKKKKKKKKYYTACRTPNAIITNNHLKKLIKANRILHRK